MTSTNAGEIISPLCSISICHIENPPDTFIENRFSIKVLTVSEVLAFLKGTMMLSPLEVSSLITRQTAGLDQNQLNRWKSLISILYPKSMNEVVDFMPSWTLLHFFELSGPVGSFSNVLARNMLRFFKDGQTVILTQNDGSLLWINNFPVPMDTTEWAHFVEKQPEVIARCIPSATRPDKADVLFSEFSSGVPTWIVPESLPLQLPNGESIAVLRKSDFADDSQFYQIYIKLISEMVVRSIEAKQPEMTKSTVTQMIALIQIIILSIVSNSRADLTEKLASRYQKCFDSLDNGTIGRYKIPRNLNS